MQNERTKFNKSLYLVFDTDNHVEKALGAPSDIRERKMCFIQSLCTGFITGCGEMTVVARSA